MSQQQERYKTYEAEQSDSVGGTPVYVHPPDGESYPLPERQDIANHSPDGFSWGYGGSGPAQLALAILADCTTEEFAIANYQTLKWALIADFPSDIPFEVSERQVYDAVGRPEDEA